MAEMDLPDIDLDGRVVIMTGADRGLGRAMSLGLAKKGARLVLASPVINGLNAVAEEITAIAGPGRAIRCAISTRRVRARRPSIRPPIFGRATSKAKASRSMRCCPAAPATTATSTARRNPGARCSPPIL